MKRHTDKSWLVYATSFALILIWGGAYTMVGVAVRSFEPIHLVTVRLIIGAALIVTIMIARGERFPPLRDIRWASYAGLAVIGSVLPFFMLSTGQQYVDSGLTSILAGSLPLFTIILAHFFADERLTRLKTAGFILGFLGVVVLFLPADLSLDLVSEWPYQVLIIGAAIFYAATTVGAKRAPPTSALVGGAMMLMIAAGISTIASVVHGLPEQPPTSLAWGMAAMLGLVCTGLATVLYLWVIDMAGPSFLAKLNYFVPIASVAFGVILLNETLDWRMGVALVLILMGVWLSRTQRSVDQTLPLSAAKGLDGSISGSASSSEPMAKP